MQWYLCENVFSTICSFVEKAKAKMGLNGEEKKEDEEKKKDEEEKKKADEDVEASTAPAPARARAPAGYKVRKQRKGWRKVEGTDSWDEISISGVRTLVTF